VGTAATVEAARVERWAGSAAAVETAETSRSTFLERLFTAQRWWKVEEVVFRELARCPVSAGPAEWAAPDFSDPVRTAMLDFRRQLSPTTAASVRKAQSGR